MKGSARLPKGLHTGNTFLLLAYVAVLAGLLSWMMSRPGGDLVQGPVVIFEDGKLLSGASKAIDLLKSDLDLFRSLACASILGLGFFVKSTYEKKPAIPSMHFWLMIFGLSFATASLLLGQTALIELRNELFFGQMISAGYFRFSAGQQSAAMMSVLITGYLFVERYSAKSVEGQEP